jgi:hypothetical protein
MTAWCSPRELASFLGQSHFPGMGWFSLVGVHAGLESWLEQCRDAAGRRVPDVGQQPLRARACLGARPAVSVTTLSLLLR